MKELIEKLIKVQSELNAPKNQKNKFGGYTYRSCEDIFEAVKPLLQKEGLMLSVSDELVLIGERYYIKAIATITNGIDKIENTAYAREEESKKGMDASQVTGSTSSYARKYALNGLLLIDDNKDIDSMDNSKKEDPKFEMVGEPVLVKKKQDELIDETKTHDQLMRILDKLISDKNVDYDKLIAMYKLDDIQLMTVKQLQNAIANIDKFEKVGK